MQQIFLEKKAVGKINLLHRRKLQHIKEYVMQQVTEAPKGTTFALDMSQVADINGSGADEIIGKTIKWLVDEQKEHGKYLFLENLSPDIEHDHEYNIHTSLNLEELCIVAKLNDGYRILGYLGGTRDSLKEILDFVYQNKETTAREVASSMEKKLNTASTQLSKLHALRLIKRMETQLQEGGRQFIYKSLF
ncbi:hypothetical protein [Bacillus wiedmannii]|uniref:hypothetical protein n=1 Tax=Bacillus wiedmannii TaxID=1890302 RepID=UPI0007F05544|nr:hypothetical protein [Bacillus wiedmannii]ANN34453.1 hypothetical protein A9498_24280 [Bacillus thuringiensis serovar coreanensis]PFZ98055.1 hypothetical protein COL78_12610 [Bacillus wiedmannii]